VAFTDDGVASTERYAVYKAASVALRLPFIIVFMVLFLSSFLSEIRRGEFSKNPLRLLQSKASASYYAAVDLDVHAIRASSERVRV
jgi:hypothetical protein